VRREVRGLGEPSHGLSPRSRGALLGFGDALIVAQLLAIGLGGRERGLGAGRNRIALVLGDSGKDVQRQLTGGQLKCTSVIRHPQLKVESRDRLEDLALT
jgi:hypothetical protein